MSTAAIGTTGIVYTHMGTYPVTVTDVQTGVITVIPDVTGERIPGRPEVYTRRTSGKLIQLGRSAKGGPELVI